jgi:uncharacterized membrane-anchored protein YitT (DUF2179 family)
MVGIGFVVLFRHKASLGGVNILALYLQDKSGIRAGKFQMVVDACIVTASLFLEPADARGLYPRRRDFEFHYCHEPPPRTLCGVMD